MCVLLFDFGDSVIGSTCGRCYVVDVLALTTSLTPAQPPRVHPLQMEAQLTAVTSSLNTLGVVL